MKFNWGTGIVFSFVIFAAAMVLIIVFPFNQKVDLVTKDYYQKELIYQEQIDKSSRANSLDEEIILRQNKDAIEISFPGSYGQITGEILFYRPSDSVKDFNKVITADSSGKQIINTTALDPGLWKIKIHWKMGDNYYYNEKTVMI